MKTTVKNTSDALCFIFDPIQEIDAPEVAVSASRDCAQDATHTKLGIDANTADSPRSPHRCP
jgi:hypothetical protein